MPQEKFLAFRIHFGRENADLHILIPAKHTPLALARGKIRKRHAERLDELDLIIIPQHHTVAEKIRTEVPPAQRPQAIHQSGLRMIELAGLMNQRWKIRHH
jgi:hypothetical protein